MATFDNNSLSDLYKEAHGVRPRGEAFWSAWNNADDAGKQSIWDSLCKTADERFTEEHTQQMRAAADVEARIAELISMGAGDRATAVRWLAQAHGAFYQESQTMDADYLAWSLNVPYGYFRPTA